MRWDKQKHESFRAPASYVKPRLKDALCATMMMKTGHQRPDVHLDASAFARPC